MNINGKSFTLYPLAANIEDSWRRLCKQFAPRWSNLHPVSSLSPIWRLHVQEPKGDPRKTWSDCVRADMNAYSLGGINPQNRTAWRPGIRSISRLLPTPSYWDRPQQLNIKSGSSQIKSQCLCCTVLSNLVNIYCGFSRLNTPHPAFISAHFVELFPQSGFSIIADFHSSIVGIPHLFPHFCGTISAIWFPHFMDFSNSVLRIYFCNFYLLRISMQQISAAQHFALFPHYLRKKNSEKLWNSAIFAEIWGYDLAMQ